MKWVLRLMVIAVGFALAACTGPPVGEASPAATGDTSTDSPSEWTGVTRNVPSEYPTIQAGVDASDPGDLVLVERGVYNETVSVTTDGLTIRGVDRNEVVIDGEFERFNGVEVLVRRDLGGIEFRDLVTHGHGPWLGHEGVDSAESVLPADTHIDEPEGI